MIAGLFKAIFGGLGLTDIIKYAAKFALIISVLGIVSTFTSFLIGKIPNLSLSGCMGHYAQVWGFIDGFRLYVSIVLYGFVVKFTLSLVSRFFD